MQLKELRKSRKLTQNDVARFLGIPTKTYQNYEREVRDADSDVLCKLADLYGVTLDTLFGRQETEPDVPNLKSDEIELLELYRRMADSDKETFIESARVYAFAGETKKESVERAIRMAENAVSID